MGMAISCVFDKSVTELAHFPPTSCHTMKHLLLLCICAAQPLLGGTKNEPEVPLAVPKVAFLDKLTPEPVAFKDTRSAMLCREQTPEENAQNANNPHDKPNQKLEIYINPAAAEAYLDRHGVLPAGSVVVKQKLAADGKPLLYTGMQKRQAGYFPGGGDWEYFTLDAEQIVMERGRLAHCASCHERWQTQDFLARDPSARLGQAQLTSGRVILHSSKAGTTGEKLIYEHQPHKNTLGYWVNAKDFATWSFKLNKPGEFMVEILQGCGEGQGGSEVELRFIPAHQPDKPEAIKFTVVETGHFQNFIRRAVGQVKLTTPGDYKVELRALRKAANAVMDLRQVTLEPKP